MTDLRISCIHYRVRYKQPAENKKKLLQLITEAATEGADIIVTPELALSGYSFKGRRDIEGCVETEASSFISEIKRRAEYYNSYICLGLAIEDLRSRSYYNSSVIIGPDGTLMRYDKINAELRWARPGNYQQQGWLDTPWGRVGTLICSDTYYGLLPRVTALKDVDLLLVPANWPPAGLDPVEVWQARAMENAMAIAACNRTGKDLQMDCRKGESCLIDNRGEILFRKSSLSSKIFTHILPLTDGKLASSRRKKLLQSRRPGLYHSCYRRLSAVSNLGSFYDLPSPGSLSISCYVTPVQGNLLAHVATFFSDIGQYRGAKVSEFTTGSAIWLLPPANYSDGFLKIAGDICKRQNCWMLFLRQQVEPSWFFLHPDGDGVSMDVDRPEDATGESFPMVNVGPARVALVPFNAFRHPESIVAASKEGADLIVTSTQRFTDEVKLHCGVQTINSVAVACCAENGGGIWMRPENHSRWGETLASEGESCSFLLDTKLTRKKRFQDNVDFDTLLRN